MVRKYLVSLSKRGGVVSTTVANATAKALMSKYPHVVGEIDILTPLVGQKVYFLG